MHICVKWLGEDVGFFLPTITEVETLPSHSQISVYITKLDLEDYSLLPTESSLQPLRTEENITK